MLIKALKSWNRYKYRFVPWIAQNINENSPRVIVPNDSEKEELGHDEITRTLKSLFSLFVAKDKIAPFNSIATDYVFNMGTCDEVLGFTIEKEPSKLEDGGTGVFVSTGRVKKGSLVALYPGAVYQPWEPVLLVSVANPYLFRCADGIHIDGCNRGISKGLFMSCAKRDRHMGEYTCDISWLTGNALNPLSIGQYVNNQTPEFPANVAYQEYDVPADFPWDYKRFLPNIEARTMKDRDLEEYSRKRLLRMVVLVALRDIEAGEELLSSYYTLVYGEEEEEEEYEEEILTEDSESQKIEQEKQEKKQKEEQLRKQKELISKVLE